MVTIKQWVKNNKVSRKLKSGSAKASAGITMRMYRVFYILDGAEVQHPEKVYGNTKQEALEMAEKKGIKPTKLKQ